MIGCAHAAAHFSAFGSSRKALIAAFGSSRKALIAAFGSSRKRLIARHRERGSCPHIVCRRLSIRRARTASVHCDRHHRPTARDPDAFGPGGSHTHHRFRARSSDAGGRD